MGMGGYMPTASNESKKSNDSKRFKKSSNLLFTLLRAYSWAN